MENSSISRVHFPKIRLKQIKYDIPVQRCPNWKTFRQENFSKFNRCPDFKMSLRVKAKSFYVCYTYCCKCYVNSVLSEGSWRTIHTQRKIFMCHATSSGTHIWNITCKNTSSVCKNKCTLTTKLADKWGWYRTIINYIDDNIGFSNS